VFPTFFFNTYSDQLEEGIELGLFRIDTKTSVYSTIVIGMEGNQVKERT
jgi:hypothetical protein